MDTTFTPVTYDIPGFPAYQLIGHWVHFNGVKLTHAFTPNQGWVLIMGGKLVKLVDVLASIKLSRPLQAEDTAFFIDGFEANAQLSNVGVK